MEAIQTAFTTAISTLQGDVLDLLAAALPVALVITGAFLGVRYGMKFFKAVSK